MQKRGSEFSEKSKRTDIGSKYSEKGQISDPNSVKKDRYGIQWKRTDIGSEFCEKGQISDPNSVKKDRYRNRIQWKRTDSGSDSQRSDMNKNMVLTIFITVQVIGLVALAVYLITPEDSGLLISGRPILLQATERLQINTICSGYNQGKHCT